MVLVIGRTAGRSAGLDRHDNGGIVSGQRKSLEMLKSRRIVIFHSMERTLDRELPDNGKLDGFGTVGGTAVTYTGYYNDFDNSAGLVWASGPTPTARTRRTA